MNKEQHDRKVHAHAHNDSDSEWLAEATLPDASFADATV